MAKEEGLPIYMVLPQKVLMDVVHFMPVTVIALLEIKGFGKAKVKKYGEDIISIISNYCHESNIEISQEQLGTKEELEKPKKPDTKKVSFDLFKDGKTLVEIAEERSMAVTTIEGHLAHFIGMGELDVHQFVTDEKIDQISAYFKKADNYNLGPAKAAFGEDVTYGELRSVLKHLEYNKIIKVKDEKQ